MNHTITSKEAILSISMQIAMETGLSSVNMRRVAERGGIAVGSVYNYFPSKADLLAETIGMFWQTMFQKTKGCEQASDFITYVEGLFETLMKGLEEHPSFFSLHSMSFAAEEKAKGRAVMEEYFLHLKQGMLQAIQLDGKVRQDAFDEIRFPQSKFVDLILDSILGLVRKGTQSCAFLLELIRRTIY